MTPEIVAEVAASLALEQLSRGESVTLTARGASMWPFLLDGDVLTLSPVPPGRGPRLGEVVLVQPRPEGLGVIHRVVACLPGRYCVKGDALPRIDGWFGAAQLPARVIEVRRGTARFVPTRWVPLPVSFLGGLWRRLRP